MAGLRAARSDEVVLTFDAVQIVRLAPSAKSDFEPIEGGYVFGLI